MNIGIFILLNIASYLLGSFITGKDMFAKGYKLGADEERILMGVSITRTFKDNPDETLKKVAASYKQLNLEIQQKYQDLQK